MHIAVIGRGLIGSAAARHLAKAGVRVTLIGPDEPTDPTTHTGVFASHYDEGRITRGLDPWPFWSRVSRAAIARYGEIAQESGIDFFTEAGSLIATDAESLPVRQLSGARDRDGIDCAVLDDTELARRFPYFRFPANTTGFHEARNAGHISPRALVRAQATAAERFGATLIRAEATGIDETAGGVRVRTGAGELRADRVLVAAGGFSNLLLDNALDLTVYARTIVLLRIGADEVARLSGQPTLIYLEPNGDDPYLLPAIRYPDGHHWLKMGGDPVDVALQGAEIGDWFRSGGNPEVGAYLEAKVRDRMPGVQVEARRTAACVTSFSPENIATIRALSDRVSVAVAGCGRGAKCSDELGRLGAMVARGESLPGWALEPAV